MLNKISRQLSYYLRHNPTEIGLHMDLQGWVSVAELSEKTNGKFSYSILQEIVRTDAKERYEFNLEQTSVRALYGHSIPWVHLDMEKKQPPDKLYHGTALKSLASINELGLMKMSRNHVHLSADLETAKSVGMRHTGNSAVGVVLLEIDSKRMAEDDYAFYVRKNGVWLTDNVPMQYLKALTFGI